MANFDAIMESISDYHFNEADVLLESAEEMYVTEGATIQMNKTFKKFKKTYKALIKSAKNNIKLADYKAARKDIKRCEEILDDFEEEFDKIEVSFGSALCGSLFQAVISGLKACLLSIPTLGIGSFLTSLKDLYDEAIGVETTIKNEEIDMKVFNGRRNKIKGLIQGFKSKLRELSNHLPKDGSDEKVSGVDETIQSSVKESVDEIDTDDLKLSIYESCVNGEITEEERDGLLSVLESANEEIVVEPITGEVDD